MAGLLDDSGFCWICLREPSLCTCVVSGALYERMMALATPLEEGHWYWAEQDIARLEACIDELESRRNEWRPGPTAQANLDWAKRILKRRWPR